MNDLDALRELLANHPAAIYIPDTGQVFACPNAIAPLHHCDRAFTIPLAAAYADEIAAGGVQAYILAYGVLWAIR